MGLTPRQLQALHPHVPLPSKRWYVLKKRWSRGMKNLTWEDFCARFKDPHVHHGHVIGFDSSDVCQVIVLSHDELLRHALDPNRCNKGFACIDGEFKRIAKGHTIILIGTQDVAHVFHPFAWGVMTGEEPQEGVEMMLQIVDNYMLLRFNANFEAFKWMLDGSSSLRGALRAWYEQRQVPAHVALPDLELAMCKRHVWEAVRIQCAKLGIPSDQAIHDLEAVAAAGSQAMRAWTAVCVEWQRRRWDRLQAYVQTEWIDRSFGWNAGHLGVGAPDTNNGVEGTWPAMGGFLAPRSHPVVVMHALVHLIIPYYVHNKPAMAWQPALHDDEHRQAALELMERQAQVQIVRYANGHEVHYCRSRVEGKHRPITEEDVDRYDDLQRPDMATCLTYADVMFMATMRRFDVDMCSCAAAIVHRRCIHQTSIRLATGVTPGNARRVNPRERRAAGRYRHKGAAQDISDTKCFICGKEAMSIPNLVQHYQSKAHRKFEQSLLAALALDEPVEWSGDVVVQATSVATLTEGMRILLVDDGHLLGGRVRTIKQEPLSVCARIFDGSDQELSVVHVVYSITGPSMDR